MRLFYLHRDGEPAPARPRRRRPAGESGGIVAEGVVFGDDSVVVSWPEGKKEQWPALETLLTALRAGLPRLRLLWIEELLAYPAAARQVQPVFQRSNQSEFRR